MAQRTIVTFTDDLTGDKIARGAGGTVQFGFDGNMYEIDLSDDNKDASREAMSDYVAAGRKVAGSSARTGSKRGSGERSDPDELAKIRAWAKDNGHESSSRVRIAQSVRDAYAGAN